MTYELFCFKTQNLKCDLPSVYRICSDCHCIVELWLCWALQHKCTDHFRSKARMDTKYHVRYTFVAMHVTTRHDATQCTKNTQRKLQCSETHSDCSLTLPAANRWQPLTVSKIYGTISGSVGRWDWDRDCFTFLISTRQSARSSPATHHYNLLILCRVKQ